MVTNYFETIFRSCALPNDNSDLVEDIKCKVLDAMNLSLSSQVISPDSPGPNRMPPIFFQRYWHIVGTDVTNAVISILSSGRMLYKINYTYVALISLCNVVYKLISKSVG